MNSLVDLVILIYSFFPGVVLLRLFVIEKGGRPRDPRTGQFVSRRYVKLVSLIVAIFATFYINPIISDWINNFCSSNPSNVYFLLVLGLILYFVVLR
ncbi:hypothetical protein J7K27_04425 [Candidatus Bathyarchaeota archaeon]|nr:hypothetical protein [Candidatus Bathyarchaeota archaeon]